MMTVEEQVSNIKIKAPMQVWAPAFLIESTNRNRCEATNTCKIPEKNLLWKETLRLVVVSEVSKVK